MAERVADHFGAYRDRLLDDAAAAGWPELILEGVGRVEGALAWIAQVEAATPAELILLSRRLAEFPA